MNSKGILLIVFFTALILSYFQTIRIDAPNYEIKLTRHNSIISNTVEYPYKYRLLNPYMANVSFTVFKTFLSEKAAFLLAYFIQNILVYTFLLFSFYKFLSLWFDDTGIIIGVLSLAVIIPLSLTGSDTMGDITTAGIMALGFFLINTGKEKWLFPLLFIAAFNELQIILLIMFYFFSKKSNFTDKKVWINCILLTAVFLAGYYIIYLLRGGEAGSSEYKWYFTKDAAFNVAHKDWILLWLIMIPPYLFFAVKDFKLKPEFLKRSALIVLPLFYFAAFFFIARLREIDKALTIFIILIPLALFSLIPKHVKEIKAQP